MGVTARLLAQIYDLKADNARLEKEADWLAARLEYNGTPHECELASIRTGGWPEPCKKTLKEQNCKQCWREAARKALAEQK